MPTNSRVSSEQIEAVTLVPANALIASEQVEAVTLIPAKAVVSSEQVEAVTLVPAKALVSSFQVEAIVTYDVARVTVTAFSPSTGIPGTVVTITGADLDIAVEVDFGGVPAEVWTRVGTTSIVAVVPLGALTGDVVVVDSIGSVSAPGTYTATLGPTAAYVYENATTDDPTPHIWYLYPDAANRGELVDAIGMGFGDNQAEFLGSLNLSETLLVVAEWFKVIADSSGLTEDRQIRPGTDRANPEHQRIRFVVPQTAQSGNVRVVEVG